MAGIAGDVGGGEEVHFEFDAAIAVAFFAASAGGVEGEARDIVTTGAGFGELGEDFADFIEDADVGGRATAGGFADGALIDFVNVFDVLEIFHFAKVRGFSSAGGDGEAAVHEGGFAGARNACEDGEATEGDVDVDVFQVIDGAFLDGEKIFCDGTAGASYRVGDGGGEGAVGGGLTSGK